MALMGESSLNMTELERLRPPASTEEDTKETTKGIEGRRCQRLLLEPVLIGAMMAINLGQTSLQNFYLRTACNIDLGHSLEDCEAVHGGVLEADSQTVVSGVNISRSFVGSVIATVLLLFVGPWSDYSGRRKPLLILPLTGMCVMTTGVILMLTFPGASTVQVLYAVQIPISMGGNFGLLLTAAFSHIGDLCHATGRDVTRTMGTHRAAIQVAHVLGSVSGPLLFRTFGYYGVFPIVLLLQVSSLLYVIFFMEDVNVNTENKLSVINWRLPFNAIGCLLKKREGKKRMIIFFMLIVALGDRMMLSAEVLLTYMYYRYKFNWNDIMYGSFLAYRNITSFLGTLVILTILKKRLQLSDEIVGVMSCISNAIVTSGLIISTTTFCVFLLPLVGLISQGSQVVQRPILNKQISPNEQGKIYSVLAALESATQTFSSPLYSLLYKRTVANAPDAWLIPGIILATIQALSYYTTRMIIGSPPVNVAEKKNIPLNTVTNPTEEKSEMLNEKAKLEEKTEDSKLGNENKKSDLLSKKSEDTDKTTKINNPD